MGLLPIPCSLLAVHFITGTRALSRADISLVGAVHGSPGDVMRFGVSSTVLSIFLVPRPLGNSWGASGSWHIPVLTAGGGAMVRTSMISSASHVQRSHS